VSEENRRFTRVKFAVPAVITIGTTVFSVKEITNLSVGGALIPCEKKFDRLTKCLFQIPITGTTENLSVQIEGEFVWSNDEFAAIKFTSISPDSLQLLQKIILYNAEDTSKVEDELKEHRGLL
jgi:PilZ domain